MFPPIQIVHLFLKVSLGSLFTLVVGPPQGTDLTWAFLLDILCQELNDFDDD